MSNGTSASIMSTVMAAAAVGVPWVQRPNTMAGKVTLSWPRLAVRSAESPET